jgi:asparagine synthase (glutamine-hydrolysing)
MCGIFCVFGKKGFKFGKDNMSTYDNNAKLLDHRGDTSKKYIVNNQLYLYHRRLAINDLSKNGEQPFYIDGIFCMINGEIYNYNELKTLLGSSSGGSGSYKFKSSSDCEILIPLYKQFGTQFINKLKGMFSFIIYDTKKKLLLVSRDHIGMTSLYYGVKDDNLYFASEMKCLVNICDDIKNFPVGNVYIYNTAGSGEGMFFDYNKTTLWKTGYDEIKNNVSGNKFISFEPYILENIKNKFIATVKSHLHSDVPIGILLSGGLDSSLVASIVNRLKMDGEYIGDIKTFTIGVENSVDIQYADTVATYLNSEHTAYNFEAADAITILEEVIEAVETYDITTIRASIPLYLLSKWIKEDYEDIKVILSGEVSDEIFAGYAYFKHAPDSKELFEETVDKTNWLNKYDCLRAHKATMANTLELRVPFGDKDFVDYIMSLDPLCKMYGFSLGGEDDSKKIEKYILRKAFEGWLPESVLWRKKEQFSDGVSSSSENVIDTLKSHAESIISDEEMNNASVLFPIHTPITKEGLMYYKIFLNKFPHESCLKTVDHNIKSIACSTERALTWMNINEGDSVNDPSGRIE